MAHPIVMTTSGKVRGSVVDGVCRFYGVPYAAPPVGALRFQKPARPGDEIHATAGLTENRRGKIFHAQGELRNPKGEVLASATGKYLPIAEADQAEMAEDFVGGSDEKRLKAEG